MAVAKLGTSGLMVGLLFAFLAASPAGVADATDDPCFRAPNVNTGALLSEDCKSWVCIANSEFGISSHCNNPVNPGGNSLYIEVLWMPEVLMTSWTLHGEAFDEATGNWTSCPDWSGVGTPPPRSLAPCTLSGAGPWLTSFDLELPTMILTDPSTWHRGTVGMQLGHQVV